MSVAEPRHFGRSRFEGPAPGLGSDLNETRWDVKTNLKWFKVGVGAKKPEPVKNGPASQHCRQLH